MNIRTRILLIFFVGIVASFTQPLLATDLFPNLSPGTLRAEKRAAERAGITPTVFDPHTAPRDIELKYVVLEDDTMIIAPKFHNGVEIVTHAVLADGASVKAAGDFELSYGMGTYHVLEVTRHSGHYQPDEASLGTAVDVLTSHGVNVLWVEPGIDD